MYVMEKAANEKRLIDANALQSVLLPITSDLEHEYGSLGGAVSGVMKHIDSAPTIDAVPVRHGYWENANGRPKTYIRKCSVCGKEAYFCGRGCSYKFCPNCGADMRGNSDE